ncbi:pyridine nucleotide-disulfide oxidoreductase [Paenibacillus sp. FSL R7-0273]|uniref:NAD(P)/FAD-dependent oxidoreductase n=1 Tax=Paenibacillus sp. FSL R7-0273 TaxID=1536772 RepID=UPI0004F707F4|nr:NAD(P)/FAD-dependent oxidoreductase [Paenibacillus sp. FSL R7-0273]AIQ44594.1 pyridine nucleotide-disulfide oxidoreductase [Paenibacillus sp. FSL R7-0273]OMF88268.1 pyridine nucleotide-disulfide oxidoreductase [Paenibacillus sp. FSL R7-0273]
MRYDAIIVGGGFAGLQAAIQLGRYSVHRVLVIDAGAGRSTLCRGYHNILGWPDGVSGEELRAKGHQQAETAGVAFVTDRILTAQKKDGFFLLSGQQGQQYEATTLLLATGVMDRFPELPGIKETMGRTLYVCPDCDGYEIEKRQTVLLGSGDAGANMAFVLRERTGDLTYINHEREPVSPENMERIHDQGIRYIEKTAAKIDHENNGFIKKIVMENGEEIPAERGFIAFGRNAVHSELAAQLGVNLHKNRHVEANSRSLMTNVDNLWVAGDIAVHAEQATVAMGEGAIAGIWMNKVLKKLNPPVLPVSKHAVCSTKKH